MSDRTLLTADQLEALMDKAPEIVAAGNALEPLEIAFLAGAAHQREQEIFLVLGGLDHDGMSPRAVFFSQADADAMMATLIAYDATAPVFPRNKEFNSSAMNEFHTKADAWHEAHPLGADNIVLDRYCVIAMRPHSTPRMDAADSAVMTAVNCGCRQCTRARDAAAPHVVFFTEERSRMILCETCGNKRCPHANDHRNACTGSNEPGQPGSAYP